MGIPQKSDAIQQRKTDQQEAVDEFTKSIADQISNHDFESSPSLHIPVPGKLDRSRVNDVVLELRNKGYTVATKKGFGRAQGTQSLEIK